MIFYREFGTAEEFAEVLKPIGGEIVQTARGEGHWSALRLALPSSEVIHCEAGAAVSGRGILRPGRICFLMPWRKPYPYYYRGIEMPGNGVALYTEGVEHVGRGSGPGAWTLFVIEGARFLQHLSRFQGGADGPAPRSFIPIELHPRRRAKVEGIVNEIARARLDPQKAESYRRPAVLRSTPLGRGKDRAARTASYKADRDSADSVSNSSAFHPDKLRRVAPRHTLAIGRRKKIEVLQLDERTARVVERKVGTERQRLDPQRLD